LALVKKIKKTKGDKKMTGRVFTASLKPAWTTEDLEQFCSSLIGTAIVWAITHDKDFDSDTGELIESHTHILLEYDTPRKITTVANLLKVAPNFVELVKSKKAFIRYLTHMDDPDKHQYDHSEIITNSSVAYQDVILGQNLSDKEIASYIMSGRGIELMGVVSASKLRTIQAFLHFDRTGAIQREIEKLNDKLQMVTDVVINIDGILNAFREGLMNTGIQMKEGLNQIANEISKVNQIAKARATKGR
jgi:hypothetical protein